MRVQRPVFTDFAFKAELFTVGRQQQLDRRSVKADPVVQGLHLVFSINTLDGHHRHQDVFLFNQARVAGKQRFDKERLIGNHHEVNPRARNIHARQVTLVIHQLVHLRDDDAVMERGGFHQRRGIFGARPGIEVAFAVGFKAGNQRHVGRQVDVETGVEFDIGVNRADFELTILQQLGDAQALRPGEGEIQLAGDAFLKDIQMFAAANARHDHMQIVDDLRVHFGQRAGKEIGLLLVVTFQHDLVAWRDQFFQHGDEIAGWQYLALHRYGGQTTRFFAASRVPLPGGCLPR